MAKMWEGRTSGRTDVKADDFNSSIGFDSRMYRQDIRGSMAHAAMLEAQGIISHEDGEKIMEGLQKILSDLDDGTLAIDYSCEDIHMFVEQVLTGRIGDAGKKLHTARSRNDQVALDIRMYLRDETEALLKLLKALIGVIIEKAGENEDAVMPGYTHLQHAQPVLFAHHLLAYGMMFSRDMGRLKDACGRINVSPIGSCALAGTTYPTDRRFEAEKLGFPEICLNSMDGVSDRDFGVEFLSCCSLIMMHLSRLSEELILWTSSEFGFVELDDAYTTGSSIMPQKKNSDMAELCRGKTGRVYGDLICLLTVLKGLPLAYNKDMQEDKEPLFDAADTVKHCLEIMTAMLDTMRVNKDRMFKAAQTGYMNATDLADYLVGKGMSFRDAYKVSGKIVGECVRTGTILEELPLERYRAFEDRIDRNVYDAVDIRNCVDRRTSEGGTSKVSAAAQIDYLKKQCGD